MSEIQAIIDSEQPNQIQPESTQPDSSSSFLAGKGPAKNPPTANFEPMDTTASGIQPSMKEDQPLPPNALAVTDAEGLSLEEEKGVPPPPAAGPADVSRQPDTHTKDDEIDHVAAQIHSREAKLKQISQDIYKW